MSTSTYIVEDNGLILESLTETLEETAHVCVVGSASTAHEAIEWLTGHSSDWQLAIVDMFLLEGTGLEVLRACMNRRPSQRAIVLTNYATHEMRRACEELGANAVFDKSTEIDELIEFCTRLARGST